MAGYLSPAAYLYVEEQEYLQAYEDVLERYKVATWPVACGSTLFHYMIQGILFYAEVLDPLDFSFVQGDNLNFDLFKSLEFMDDKELSNT
ncbi:hypothetical protein STEG23_009427 [Scotinomys teguina]